MRLVRYADGLVCFRLPASWREELEGDGDGLYYPPDDDSIALRLGVIRGDGKSAVPSRELEEILRGSRPQARVEQLPTGHWLVVDPPGRATEDGEALEIYTWRVGRLLTVPGLRVAVFTLAVVTGQAIPRESELVLQMLTKEIRNCRIADRVPA